MKKKRSLRKFFNRFPTNVCLSEHDKEFYIRPKAAQKKYKKMWGVEAKPTLYNPIVIHWSEKGRGFGEYVF